MKIVYDFSIFDPFLKSIAIRTRAVVAPCSYNLGEA